MFGRALRRHADTRSHSCDAAWGGSRTRPGSAVVRSSSLGCGTRRGSDLPHQVERGTTERLGIGLLGYHNKCDVDCHIGRTSSRICQNPVGPGRLIAVPEADGDADLNFAIGDGVTRTQPRTLSSAAVDISGVLTDLYDFDYDAPAPFNSDPAGVQTGFNGTTRRGGRVYKVEAHFAGTRVARAFSY